MTWLNGSPTISMRHRVREVSGRKRMAPICRQGAILMDSVGLEVEIKARMMLKLQTPFRAIGSPPDYDKRSHEADDLEVVGELPGVPDVPILRFQGFPASGFQVDLGKVLAADRLCWVGHATLSIR